MFLEQSGSIVLLTRDDDNALGDTKNTDLSARKNIANEQHADIMISIHQNSFPKANVRGAQVFYFSGSSASKFLAESIQHELIAFIDPNSTKRATASESYYMLKKPIVPSVIVECGFLSNPGEEGLLNTEEHQEKIAWAIYLGIVNYFQNHMPPQ